MRVFYAETQNPRKAYAVTKQLNADIELIRRIQPAQLADAYSEASSQMAQRSPRTAASASMRCRPRRTACRDRARPGTDRAGTHEPKPRQARGLAPDSALSI